MAAKKQPGRVPGSGANYSTGKGRKEFLPGGGYVRVSGPKSNAKWFGAEGPKKSSPRKKRGK